MKPNRQTKRVADYAEWNTTFINAHTLTVTMETTENGALVEAFEVTNDGRPMNNRGIWSILAENYDKNDASKKCPMPLILKRKHRHNPKYLLNDLGNIYGGTA